jgi:hypothetical protein
MIYIINERQYRLLVEQDEILNIPFHVFNNDWDLLQKFLNRRGNPPYKISGDLDLFESEVESLGNLTSVGGGLNLYKSQIKSLGNLTSVSGNLYLNGAPIKFLENLISVGNDLILFETQIESLGNLKSVGGDLDLENTPMSITHTEKNIRDKINVGGDIFL